jgi:hypothetical protein
MFSFYNCLDLLRVHLNTFTGSYDEPEVFGFFAFKLALLDI